MTGVLALGTILFAALLVVAVVMLVLLWANEGGLNT
jgi:hypothetical protein